MSYVLFYHIVLKFEFPDTEFLSASRPHIGLIPLTGIHTTNLAYILPIWHTYYQFGIHTTNFFAKSYDEADSLLS